jgi:NAD-dependent deacetylase
MKPKLVVLSGAGISAESGIKTFRDSNGLWEEYNVEDVATPEGWAKNNALVLEFYNKRRKQAQGAKPNKAHYALAELEEKFDVHIITQNVDNLHERAGSTKVLHLHGELMKSRSTINPKLIYDIKGTELNLGDTCEMGSQLRPHIVWFGEAVPEMTNAYFIAQHADIFMVIGTSMLVYPAASLIDYVNSHIPKYLIDPNDVNLSGIDNLTVIKEKATKGMETFLKKYL